MEVLEDREKRLRARIGTANREDEEPILTRLQSLEAQLYDVTSRIPGYYSLHENYTSNQALLNHRSSLLSSHAEEGDAIKRAILLTSESQVEDYAHQLRTIDSLSPVLNHLRSFQTQLPEIQSQIRRTKDTADHNAEQALQLHRRVQALVGTYRLMIQILSEKLSAAHEAVSVLESRIS